jgi:hypothetical protein
MDIALHADACYQQFGKPYFDVHHFLDQFAFEFSGYAHRRLLHHQLGVNLVVMEFGETARQAAELHIRQDTSDSIPEDWSDYGEPILLQLEDYDRQDAILKELYGTDIFYAVQAKLNELGQLNGGG